jgi:threonine/homoserine/homoserine lactone efflux protein
VGISNPKDLLFFGALFPQFIDTEEPLLGQVGMLSATWCLVAFGIMNDYAAIGARIARSVDAFNDQEILSGGRIGLGEARRYLSVSARRTA